MKIVARAFSRRALLAALGAALAAGCSSGGHSPAPSDCQVAPALPAGQAFTLSGNVTYDFVPASYDPVTGGGGLQFGLAQQRAVREADVEIRQCDTVLATATTDTAGHYTATFTPGATGRLYVYVLARTTNPPIQVQDNTDLDAVWAVGQPIDSAGPTLDVRATHGWTGSGYGPSRIAAPFAILDSMYTAAHRLLDVPRAVTFPPLAVNWSPANFPSDWYQPSVGAIVTSHYEPWGNQIFILGAEWVDTDEFDRVVIVHEWSHYFEATLSRADSPGGSHGFGWVLDPRVAFSEGYASAYASMLLQQPVYADTYWGASGQDAFGWDVENRPTPTDDPAPSVFSELTVIRAMWDLYDPGSNEAWDGVALDLGPIYDALVGPQKTTPALTTIGSFITALKAQPGVDSAAVDAVLAHYYVGPITSPWGDGDTDLRAMYVEIAAPSPSPAVLPATLNGSFAWNERPQNQYYVFTAAGTQATVVASSTEDVDLYAVASGTLLARDERPYTESQIAQVTFATTPGDVYVVVLTGWGGADPAKPVGAYAATVSFSGTP